MGNKQSEVEVEAIEAERAHGVIASGFTHHPSGKLVVTKDFDATLYLGGVMRLVEDIQASTEGLSVLTTSAKGFPSIRFNKLGLDLFLACRQYSSKVCQEVEGELRPLYAGRRLHPFLAVGLPVIAEFERQIQLAAEVNHEQLHGLISIMVDRIREGCRAEHANEKVRAIVANSRARLGRALRYILSLFRKRSRLLLLRVDLYVRPGAREWGYTTEADAAFDHFADALARSQIVPDVQGWMIAREDGLERGQHYHVLVAVDGHKHHAGVNLAKLIGEYWVNACVGSTNVASYFNCFALTKAYRFLGIGMVRFDDGDKLLGVYHAVRYLCKESVILMPTSARPRNFRRGVEDKDYVRRGAPRQMDDCLQLAEEVLLRPRPRKKPATCSPRHRLYLNECPE